MTIAPHNPITVAANDQGQPTLHWELDVATADQILTLLGGSTINLQDPVFAGRVLDPLYLAVSQAVDGSPTHTNGCTGLWPDAAPLPLYEPAVLGNDTGDMLAVLIPGDVDYLTAITTAVAVAHEAGATIDPTDPNLIAEVDQPRWLILNACESSNHDFHPELAPHGGRSNGAVLVTRVTLTTT